MSNQTYLGWYDPSKIPADRKVTLAMERYEEKFGMLPTVVLVNAELGALAIDGVDVRTSPLVTSPHIFYLGRETS